MLERLRGLDGPGRRLLAVSPCRAAVHTYYVRTYSRRIVVIISVTWILKKGVTRKQAQKV